MAVLKDLIVHGPSRFINTAQFESLNTNKIGAEEGVFNKIVATTGDIGSLTVEDLTAGKATVLSLLDVRGELHTNQWTNSNIATIDGSFYITPTIGIPEGTMTTTANSLSVYGSNFPISSVYVNGINSDNTAGTVAWATGSKVLVTGEILVNGTYMPLGTLVGTLGSNVTASRIDISSITDNRYQTAASLAEIGTQSTALPCRNVKVSLYQTSRSSTLYPLGIFMTALGENGKTFLDIYGGGYATSTATAGGFARPVLRIGNLAGLPDVGGKTPVGYGIYTSNGYFSGTIVSTSGKIANFTINGSKMYSNNHSAYNTATNGIYIGDDYISFGNGGVTYFNTSGTGKIGPWTLTTTALYNSKSSYNASVSGGGVYIGTDYIAGGNGEVWWLKKDGSAKIGAMTLTAAGVLSVPAANITGTLTASQVDVSGIITAGSIVTNTLTGGTFNTADYIRVSTQSSSSLTIGNSGAKTDWRIIAGKTFGVDKAGNLYATSANITGAIVATSLDLTTNNVKIGSGSVNGLSTVATSGKYTDLTSTPDLTVYIAKDGVIGTEPSDSAASTTTGFKVSSAGLLKAANAVITGKIFATSGTIGGWNIGTDGHKSLYAYTNSTTTSSPVPGTTGLLLLSPQSSNTNTAAIAGSGTGLKWFMSASNVFGVTDAGALYSTSGKIGGWTIDTNKIYSGTHSTWNSTAEDGLYLGNDGIAGGSGGIWYLWKDGSAKIGAMTLSAAGVLTVPAANVSGQLTAATIGADKLTAGTIDSSILTSNNIVTDTITMGTAGSNAYIYVSKNNKSTAINSETKNWRIILGNVFGVSEAGYLTASSGKIGGFNLTTNAIYSTANALGTTANNVYLGTEGISLGTTFKVTKAGVLTATGVDISGAITSTSGFYVKTSSTGDYIAQMTGSGISLGNAGTNGSTYTTYNIQINPDTSTGGILLRKGTQVLNQIDSSGMTIRNASGTSIAQFGNTTRVGPESDMHFLTTGSRVGAFNGTNTLFDFNNAGTSITDTVSKTLFAGRVMHFPIGESNKETVVLSGIITNSSTLTVYIDGTSATTFTKGTSATKTIDSTIKVTYDGNATMSYYATDLSGEDQNSRLNLSVRYSTTTEAATYVIGSGIASGAYSIAFNHNTIASSEYQSVFGKNNEEDTANKYSIIVGKGSSGTNRSNAMTLDWSGNLMITGSFSMANSGTTTSITVAANNNATKNISFSGFTSAPHVIATLVGVSSTTHQLVVSVSDIKTTGATINIRNNGTAQRSAKVSWIAIG